MDEALVVEIARETIIVTIQLIGPPMLIALVVGIAISLFQTVTSINEQTLSFAPKIVIMMIAVLVLLPFMIGTLTSFMERLVDRVISIG